MIILDENIPKSQKLILESWGLKVRQVGLDIGLKGQPDAEIITLLHRQRRPTFVTRDLDFFDRRLCHSGYCLVYLTVEKYESAFFVRRLLRHPAMRTRSMRMGSVIRVSAAGIWIWRLNAEKDEFIAWN